MVYIFYGFSYKNNYTKALKFAYTITQSPIIINETITNYNKEDIELFLYYFSLPASENEPSVILIEHPENIKEIIFQSFLFYFENIPAFHTIILITNQLQKIQKTIISRSILLFQKEYNEEELIYNEFITTLAAENFINKSIENLIDLYNITEKNTFDASIILLQRYPHLQKELNFMLKRYLPFIKNSYYLYWKIIFLTLKKNKLNI